MYVYNYITIFLCLVVNRLMGHELERLGQMLLAEGKFAGGPDFGVLFTVG